MDRYEVGMLAKSQAGHDKGKVYVITAAEGSYVYLADGKVRTLEHLKKKKKKHIQLICRRAAAAKLDNEQIKRILREFKKEEGEQEE